MESLLNVPAIIKIFVIFCGILISGRIKIPLGLVLFISSLVLCLWFGMGLAGSLNIMIKGVLSADAFLLVIMICLIILFSSCLQVTGRMQKIVESFKNAVKSTKVSLMALPALIGFLPMPGGALFSAPMVEAAAGRHDLSPEIKSSINHFFRHIWETWWPLYPGIIIFLSLTRMDVSKVVLINFLVTPISVLCGYALITRKFSIEDANKPEHGPRFGPFIREVMPIVVVILSILVFNGIFYAIKKAINVTIPFMNYLPIYLGMAAGIIFLLFQGEIKIGPIMAEVTRKKNMEIVIMLFGVMAFKSSLEESGTIAEFIKDLERYHLSPNVIIYALPLFAGIVIGFMFGIIGATFPLIIPIVQASPLVSNEIYHYFVCMLFAYFGMMLSPIHMCLILTKEHFGASLIGIYRHLIPPMVGMLAITYIYYQILNYIIGF